MKLKNNLAIMAALPGLTLGQLAEKAGINRKTFRSSSAGVLVPL